MTFDPAHFPDRPAQEADRMADERDEAQERADRFDEMAPGSYRVDRYEFELDTGELLRITPVHPAQED